MTHDVDALHKTFPIRIKQTAFNIYNAFSAVRVGNLPLAFQRFRQAVRFFVVMKTGGYLIAFASRKIGRNLGYLAFLF